MKFGVNLINPGPGAWPDSLTRWAMLTETLGYHFLMTSDHLAITPDVQERYPAPFYEPFTTSGMARRRDAAHRNWHDGDSATVPQSLRRGA